MVYGKKDYTIDLSSDRHIEQISELTKMYNAGITAAIFEKFTNNVNNSFKGHSDPDRIKSLEDWAEFFIPFSPKEVVFSKEHIELLFQYLRKANYGGSIQIKADSIHSTMERIDFKVQCKLEYVVLTTLEIANKEA